MELFYRSFGEGKPIIILHGLLGMSDNWMQPARQLAKTYRVVVPDLRNHGNSPHSATFHLQALADDILELVNTLGLHSIYLLGHSLGGRIAISLALQHPNLIEKLVVVDIAPRAYSGSKSIANLLTAMSKVEFKNHKSLSEIEVFLARFIPDVRVRQLVLKNIKRLEPELFGWKCNFDVILSHVETLMSPVSESLPFQKPTLFITGGMPDFVLPHDYKTIMQYFPSAVIQSIPNASHWVHADEPQLFLDAVAAFLGN
ncbi:MAG: alpha/beta fold hydrolase [Bacteroidota bacterium]